MRILIIRHGDPYYPTDSLTEKGKREAELLSRRLVNENITQIYLSPLGRAQLTAAPTLKKLEKTGVTLDWLQEFPVPLKKAYATKLFEKTVIPWDMPPEIWTRIQNVYDPVKWRDADIYKDAGIVAMYDHIGAKFDTLIEEHGFIKKDGYYRIQEGYENSTETIVFFCHLGLGNSLIAHITGLALPVVWQTIFLPPASITTVFMEKHLDAPVAIGRLTGVGDTAHLYAGGEPVSCSGLHTKELR